MKIVVIGASGEIGARLVQHILMNGGDVRAISRRLSPRLARWKQIDFKTIDLTDKPSLIKATQGCDVVINCAVDKTPYVKARDSIIKNVHIFQNILEASRENSIQRLIHLSSIVVLPPRITPEIVKQVFYYSKEKDWYTRTKIETERIALDYQNKLNICNIRPGIVYGAHMNWSKLAISRCLLSKIALPDTENSECYSVHVDDVVGLIIHLIGFEGDLPKLVYAINPEKVSWLRFYQGHAEGAGLSGERVIQISPKVLKSMQEKYLIGVLQWARSSPLIPNSVTNATVTKKITKWLKPIIGYQKKISTDVDNVFKETIRYPNRFELEMYNSNAVFKPEQTGISSGYTYQVPFDLGCKNASDWWNFQVSISN